MKKMNLLLVVFFAMLSIAAFAQPDSDLKAETGKCYAKCLTPAKFETVSVPFTVKVASTKVSVTPASFADASEQVLSQEGRKVFSANEATFKNASNSLLSKEGYKVLKVIPAVFETVTVQELVKETYKVTKVIPATYKTETYTKMVKPGYATYAKKPAKYKAEDETIETAPSNTKWVKNRSEGNCLSADPEDCMIWCLVEVPAEFKTVTKQINVGCEDGWMLKGDDCVKATKVDAVHKTYTKKVIATPARVEYTDVPAKYKTRTYQKLVSNARVEEQIIAPVNKEWAYSALDANASATETAVPAKFVNRAFENLNTDAALTESPVDAKIINISKTRMVDEGGFVSWEEVKCELVEYSPLPINWNLNSATLTAAAKKIINEKLLPVLNQGFTVELASHTDARGSDSFNKKLSDRRAKSVKNYLISKGVKSKQMVAKGYGESKLKNRCSNGVVCSEGEHLENRRTEFKVLK